MLPINEKGDIRPNQEILHAHRGDLPAGCGIIPPVTLTADAKRRVVLPGAAPGDVFACEKRGQEIVLRPIYKGPRFVVAMLVSWQINHGDQADF